MTQTKWLVMLVWFGEEKNGTCKYLAMITQGHVVSLPGTSSVDSGFNTPKLHLAGL